MAGARCSVCGREEFLPFRCKLCAQPHCLEHRLPENHSCQGLGEYRARVREERVVAIPTGERGVPVRVRGPSKAGAGIDRALRWFRVSMTRRLLGVFILVYAFQWFGALAYSAALGQPLGAGLLATTCLLGAGSGPCGGASGLLGIAARPWTVLTASFAHDPSNPFHILFNGIFLYFVGSMIEPRIGSRRLLELFLVCGALATIVQASLFNSVVVGASGGLMGVLGTLTLLSPNLQVLFFFVPMPLWVLTSIFVVLDILGFGQPNVAHVAHLAGLAVGVAYGYRLRRRGVMPRLASSWAFQRRS